MLTSIEIDQCCGIFLCITSDLISISMLLSHFMLDTYSNLVQQNKTQTVVVRDFLTGAYLSHLDINECRDFDVHQCAFRCHNTAGSFVCTCPSGYQLSTDARHCTDVDECLSTANNCRYACKNLVGTYICVCPQGKSTMYNSCKLSFLAAFC